MQLKKKNQTKPTLTIAEEEQAGKHIYNITMRTMYGTLHEF